MAGDGTKVTLADLQDHHGKVDDIVEGLHTAVEAGGDAGALFDINAFGIVGQVFAAPIQLWVNSARSAMTDVAGAGEHISENLKDTHTEYSNNEAKCKQLFTDIHKGLS